MPGSELLITQGLTVEFGGVRALAGVNITVREGEILAVIGPNGAGKTTFFNAITGCCLPSAGRIIFDGIDITAKNPHEVARLGIARSFQNLKPFAEMTVTENVMIGRETHLKSNLFDAVLRTARYCDDEKKNLRKVRDLVDFVGLERRKNSLARNLTYGEQKMLEIARALALEPRILLLDEPVAGMNATETGFVMELVRKVKQQGITVVMIEHDMKMVMGISERIYVLDYGELIAEGIPLEIRNNPAVITAYLGGGKHAQHH